MTLTLVRHGETEWSRSRRHTGRTDVPLDEDGMRQAKLLRQRLEGHHFGAVFTSPLARAQETCRLAGFGDSAEPREELVEWDYGDYEGMTAAAIHERRPDWQLWRDGCPGGENADLVGERVDRLLAELRPLEQDAVLFAHGHVLRVLAARWIDLPPQDGGHLTLSTAAVSVLGFERGLAAIELWNDRSHLSRPW